MKITEKMLLKIKACHAGIEEFKNQDEVELIPLLNKMIELKKLDWASWLIVRCMKYKQYVSYAVYASEQAIDVYEKEYPKDKRPREAIEAARRYIKRKSKKNLEAADIAANAAACAAHDAYNVAYAASNAAYAAANAAYSATYAANAASYAVSAATRAANYASDAAAYANTHIRILRYGIKLLGEK